ncbi:energy transducer TonB [Caulobacter hibisci]|uniref:Lipoprotein n=1 Tax=Caulobacter hibisci TaxID=2035993 RepID=A0ABS0SWD2_9CAUL|nr:hypothetical protein [Caulobacter hibisci]MBI1683844.1 hypothetical protein [Caulobacter hibisci]
MRIVVPLVLSLAAAGLAGCASPPPPVIRIHGWCNEPTRVQILVTTARQSLTVTGKEASNAYADRAKRMNKNGSAILSCEPRPDGPPACTIVHEDGEYGFGFAALVLARSLSLDQKQEVRVRFELLSRFTGQATVNCDELPIPPISEAADDPKTP